MLWMNGSVAKVLRSTDAAGRDSMKRASVTYICSSSFTSFFEPSMILWTMPSLKLGNRLRNLASFGRLRLHSSKRMNAPLSDVSSVR